MAVVQGVQGVKKSGAFREVEEVQVSGRGGGQAEGNEQFF